MGSKTDSAANRQLQDELRAATSNPNDMSVDRPLVHHLNADTSWLLSLPYPPNTQRPPGRRRFNILIDVWLRGSQVDYFKWFSSQQHAIPSSLQTIKDVNEWLRNTEATSSTPGHDQKGTDRSSLCFIDAVICSHEFTDHCHEATLREIPKNVPIFAPKKAVSLISSWNYFDSVHEIPVLQPGFDWHLTTLPNLPEWIGLGRVHTQGDAPAYLHSALVIFFALATLQDVEAIVYTPHGVTAKSMKLVTTGKPPVKPLALIHGLHNVSLLGSQLNLGMENALEIQRFLHAPYWMRTHDEVKIAKGIVASFLSRIEHTLPFAPGSHPITTDSVVDDPPANVSDRSFVEVNNGEGLVLR